MHYFDFPASLYFNVLSVFSMRLLTILYLLLGWEHCLSQTTYTEILARRVDQIRSLDFFNNTVVTKNDSVEYYDLDYAYWTQANTYYRDDMVRFKYRAYRVLADSTRGHRPDTCMTDWALSGGSHPYLYLRDTATVDDLRKLMLDPHPYVRSYAFGALSFRNRNNDMFALIVDNLKDSAQIVEYSGDAGLYAYPADLMIENAADRLTESEKQKLRNLIQTKYKYLTRGLNTLGRE
jgi:hypothetical protein